MKKLALCALSLLVATSLYGCNSNESQNASVNTTKAQAASLKVVQGKLSKSVFIKVDGKEVVDDNEFKLDAKLDNIYKAEVQLEKGKHTFILADNTNSCGTLFGPNANTDIAFGSPVEMSTCAKGKFTLNVRMDGYYTFTLDYTKDVPTVKILRSTRKVEVKRQPPQIACDSWDGGPITVKVNKAWRDGTVVVDSYTGNQATVRNGKVTMTPALESEGILLLEKVQDALKPEFTWDNAVVYFMLTDRFKNGDPSNDHSYGRKNDGKDEVGTWHGGDFKGIIQKLDYLENLGVNAIWVTPIVEQVHGFIGGGSDGNFPFYGYHGYWAVDFTKIDKNLGSEEDFQRFIEEAHKRGIRVLVDVVVNHPGYATLKDLQDLNLQSLAKNTDKLPQDWSDFKPFGLYGTWGSVNAAIDYSTKDWKKWWGPDWVRAGLPGYDEPGADEITGAVGGLPDFKTEQKTPVKLPLFLKNKKDTNAVELENASVVDYLVSWHTRYVREFGVDGFRCDTVKHVDAYAWKKLKESATKALADWKMENPDKKLDDLPFFMVGEVYAQGVTKEFWFNYGFDSLINFDYQQEATTNAQCMKEADATFGKYASVVSEKGVNFLTYISSHDTKMFFADYEDFPLQKRAANSFLMLPGQVQIYYGDESGRKLAKDGGVLDQSVRSDMNWNDLNKAENRALVEHFAKLNKFRLMHPAIANGTHTKISNKPYAFMRKKGNDTVVVVSAGRRN